MSRMGWRNWDDHPAVTLMTVLASVVAIVTFARSCGPEDVQFVALDPCLDVVGRWDWLTSGGIVSIAEGGGLTWHQTTDATTPTVVGSWTCDQDTGRIELRWATGSVDDLTLSEDGGRLGGNNQVGAAISATRAR